MSFHCLFGRWREDEEETSRFEYWWSEFSQLRLCDQSPDSVADILARGDAGISIPIVVCSLIYSASL
jgi:hypothetical protein